MKPPNFRKIELPPCCGICENYGSDVNNEFGTGCVKYNIDDIYADHICDNFKERIFNEASWLYE